MFSEYERMYTLQCISLSRVSILIENISDYNIIDTNGSYIYINNEAKSI